MPGDMTSPFRQHIAELSLQLSADWRQGMLMPMILGNALPEPEHLVWSIVTVTGLLAT
jgi:hypothetical protein